MSRWATYYDHHATRRPRPLLADAVDAVTSATAVPRQAVDLGCGQGTETLALLEQSWQVLAVDVEPEAGDRLLQRVPADAIDRLTVVTAAFEDVALPPSDLVWAALALPFCPASAFPQVWASIRDALVRGGVVAVDLWGPRHAWADRTTTVTRDDLDALLGGLEVLLLDEQEEERPTVSDGRQHWHAFTVVARRP